MPGLDQNSLTQFRESMLDIVAFTFAQDDTYPYTSNKSTSKILAIDAGTDDKEYEEKYPRIIVSRDGMISQKQSIENRKELVLETYEHTIQKVRATTVYFTIKAEQLITLEYLADQLESGIWFARERYTQFAINMASSPSIGVPSQKDGHWEVVVSCAFTLISEAAITYEDETLIVSKVDVDLDADGGTSVETQSP